MERQCHRGSFLRFPLMVMYPDKDPAFRRASTAWSTLNGEKLIMLQPHSPIQQVVNEHLEDVGVVPRQRVLVNLLDTQIAMVEADEGIGIVPSFGLQACRNRKVVMSQLINPAVEVEFHQISNRGKKLPPGAGDFTEFLRGFSRDRLDCPTLYSAAGQHFTIRPVARYSEPVATELPRARALDTEA